MKSGVAEWKSLKWKLTIYVDRVNTDAGQSRFKVSKGILLAFEFNANVVLKFYPPDTSPEYCH